MSAPAPAPITRPAPPPRATGLPAITAALADIKVAHSVFALPFAILAAFLAASALAPIHWPRFTSQLALVIGCMILARTWAMLVNRLADHRFDAHNPRTTRRAIPAGRTTTPVMAAVAAACALLFCALASAFGLLYANWWPLTLALPVLAWIALYSFTKRFTALCHLFLGGALAASPLAAAIAIAPDILFSPAAPDTRTTILLLAGFITLWVAGFDVAYALQDLDFDRAANLRSIPARLGLQGALWTSRIMHAAAFALLATIALAMHTLGPLFTAATLAVGALLIFEHIVLARRGIAGLPIAFFTLNGIISLTLGAAGVIDILTT